MPHDDEEKVFKPECRDGRAVVVDADDEVFCGCGSEADAARYATMLNQAYRRGYKAGYRHAKSFYRPR